MKLENFELQSEDSINAQITCNVSIENTSSFVAKRAVSEFKIETSDGFIAFGATNVEEVEINPGGSHELNPYARTAIGVFGVSKSAKVSVKAQLYKILKVIKLELSVPEKNGVIEKLSESFGAENNEFLLKGMTWSFPNGKATDVEYTFQIESKFSIGDIDLNLQVELIDQAGNSIDLGHPSMQLALGQTPFFGACFYGVKKKDLKGLRIRYNLNLYQSIYECSGSLVEIIKIAD